MTRLQDTAARWGIALSLGQFWISALLGGIGPAIAAVLLWFAVFGPGRRFGSVFVGSILFYLVSATTASLAGNFEPGPYVLFALVTVPAIILIESRVPLPVKELVIVAGACSVFFVAESLRGTSLPVNEIIAGHNAWLAVAGWWFWQRGSRARLWMGLSILVPIGVFVWSQVLPLGPVLSGAIVGAVIVFTTVHGYWSPILKLVIAIALSALATSIALASLGEFSAEAASNNSAARWEAWVDAFIETNPLLGQGQAPVIITTPSGITADLVHSHNFIADAYRVSGLLGLLAVGIAMSGLLRGGWRATISIGLVVGSMVSNGALNQPLIWIALAFAAAYLVERRDGRRDSGGPESDDIGQTGRSNDLEHEFSGSDLWEFDPRRPEARPIHA